jgi:hypothetical protein
MFRVFEITRFLRIKVSGFQGFEVLRKSGLRGFKVIGIEFFRF